MGHVGYCKLPNAIPDPAATRQAAALLRRRRDEFGPVPAGYVLGMVKVAWRAGDLTLARRLADDWVKAAPADPAAHHWFAEVELSAEAYGPAVARAEKALSLIKGDAAAATGRGDPRPGRGPRQDDVTWPGWYGCGLGVKVVATEPCETLTLWATAGVDMPVAGRRSEKSISDRHGLSSSRPARGY